MTGTCHPRALGRVHVAGHAVRHSPTPETSAHPRVNREPEADTHRDVDADPADRDSLAGDHADANPRRRSSGSPASPRWDSPPRSWRSSSLPGATCGGVG